MSLSARFGLIAVTCPLLMGAMACGGPAVSPGVIQPAHVVHDTTADAWEVYRAVLDTLYHVDGQSPPLIVIRDSTIGSMYCAPGATQCVALPPHNTPISPSLLKFYPYVVNRLKPLRVGEYPIPIVRYSQDRDMWRLHSLAADSLKEAMMRTQFVDMWPADALAFREWFKGAWGVSNFSDVAFDSLHTQAVVQLNQSCGPGCFHIEDFVLARNPGGWKIGERILFPGLHSQGPPLPPFLYVGPDAHPHPQPYRADEFSRSAAIGGIVTSKESGAPLPDIPVVLIGGDMQVRARVVTDRSGKYRISDPPFRVSMIEAECVTHPGRKRQVLGGHDAYVRPGMDTVINFRVDLRDCLERAPVRRLDLEPFASISGSYPDSEAAGVYRAALDILYPSTESPSLIVLDDSAETGCDPYQDCWDVQLAQLESSGELDPEIVRRFSAFREPPVKISPAFSKRRIAMFNDSASAYIASETEARVNGGYTFDDSTDTMGSIFRRAYPGAREVVNLSKVAFNSDHTLGLLRVRHGSMVANEGSELILFGKTENGWTPARRHIEMLRTTAAYADKRCVAVAASADDLERSATELIGRFELERVQVAPRDDRFQWPHSKTAIKLSPVTNYQERFYMSTASGPVRYPWGYERLAAGVLFGDSSTRKDGKPRGITLMKLRQLELYTDPDPSGVGVSYEITRITRDGFFGTWRLTSNTVTTSEWGEPAVDPHGFFCAKRTALR